MSKSILNAVLAKAKNADPLVSLLPSKRDIRKIATINDWPRGANSPCIAFKMGPVVAIQQGGEKGSREENITVKGVLFLRVAIDDSLETGDPKRVGMSDLEKAFRDTFDEKHVQNPLSGYYEKEYSDDAICDVTITESEAEEFQPRSEQNPSMSRITQRKIFDVTYYRYRSA